MTTIQSSNGNQYKPANLANTALGIGAGYYTMRGIKRLGAGFQKSLGNKLQEASQGLDVAEIQKSLKEAVKESKTGVKVIDFAGTKRRGKSLNTIRKEVHRKFHDLQIDVNNKNITDPKIIIGKFKEITKSMTKDILISSPINGTNAVCVFKKNKVLINSEKLGLAGFHEIGHAMNHKSLFGKILQKSRYAAIFIPGILLANILLKRPKAEGEQPKNKFDKATDFMKNNVGKISLAASLPIVVEELLASFKGNKLAKKVCSPEVFKKVFKSNAIGGATYIIGALATAGGLVLANKVRNAMTAPKRVEK